MPTMDIPKPDIVARSSMLTHLRRITALHGELFDLVASAERWQGLSIDYHPPKVERLYTDLEATHERPALRVMLHRVHPCEPSEALWHAHPWPAAVEILRGTYEHACGFLDSAGRLRLASRSVIEDGTQYEITDPLAWHYVCPIGEPVLSIMVTGKPWSKHNAPKPVPQQELTEGERLDLLDVFRDELGLALLGDDDDVELAELLFVEAEGDDTPDDEIPF